MAESPMDMSARMNQIMQMQMRLQMHHQEVLALKAEGKDESGRVTVVYSGSLRFQSIKLAPDLVTKENKEELQKAILSACLDAVTKVQAEARTKYQAILKEYGMEQQSQDAS
jgi:DNA-binding protein YbaB